MTAQAATIERSGLPSAVRELAGELLPEAPRLANEMTVHLFAMMPELRERDDGELPEETRASCEANIAQVLRLLSLGARPDALVLPPEAAEWARSLVRRGITLVALLRAYRLEHAWLWDRWSQALHGRLADPEELVAAQERSSAFMFDYIDLISGVLVAEYGTERERMMRERGTAARRGGPQHPRRRTSRRGGRRQPLGLRAPPAPRGASRLRPRSRAARPRARGSRGRRGTGRRRAARGGLRRGQRRCVVGCLRAAGRGGRGGTRGLRAAGRDPGRRRASRSRDRRVQALAFRGAGDRARGGACGRRRGSRHALRARRARVAAGERLPARAFVAARLGPLAAATEPAARLRETVLAFLAANGSSTKVAKELYVHHNTVTYRVKRAEELLGRRVTDEPIELTCALTLAAVLGSAVLAADEDDGEPALSE